MKENDIFNRVDREPVGKVEGIKALEEAIKNSKKIEEKIKYYRILDSAGVKSDEYAKLLKEYIDDESILNLIEDKIEYAKILLKMGKFKQSDLDELEKKAREQEEAWQKVKELNKVKKNGE